jgi:hypothetical protein
MYLANGAGLAYPSPISINSSNVTLYWLSKFDTRFVSVINMAYTSNELVLLNRHLTSIFGLPAYNDNSTSIYSTDNAIKNVVNRSIIAYTSGGSWVYGCKKLSFCGPADSAFNKLWWGSSARAINVSVPADKTKLILKFTAAPPQANINLSIVLNSHQVGFVALRENITNYKLNLTLNQGMNQVVFAVSGPSPSKINPTPITVGLRNITFQRR